MKIGVSLTTTFPASVDARRAGRALVERAAAVRAAGLDSLFVGDHHGTADHYFQNVPTLARLLAETGDMLTGALFLFPVYHPVLLAEQAGTLAALAGGPFVLIAAGGSEEQFAPFSLPIKQRPSRLEEHLQIVRRLLAGERVTFQGRYQTLTDVVIHPVPAAPVPIWIAAVDGPAVERAGRLGDGWLAGGSTANLAAGAEVYRRAAAEAGRRPLIVVRRNIHVGASDAEAEAAVAPALARGYRGIQEPLIGGPERIVAELRTLHELGVEHVLVRHLLGGDLDRQDLVLDTVRRLGADVLPRVRDW